MHRTITYSQPLTAILSQRMPREALVRAWQHLSNTLDSCALSSLCPETTKRARALLECFGKRRYWDIAAKDPTFASHGHKGLLVLRTIQVTSAFSLARIAHQLGQRHKASKRLAEILSLVRDYPPFERLRTKESCGGDGLRLWVYSLICVSRMDYGKYLHEDDQVVESNPRCRGDAVTFQETDTDGPFIDQHEFTDGSKIEYEVTNFVISSDICYCCDKRSAKMAKCAKCERATCAFFPLFSGFAGCASSLLTRIFRLR